MLRPVRPLQAADEAQAAFLHSACQSLRDKMRVVEVGAAPLLLLLSWCSALQL
jgi:hypothetical protein